MFNGRVKKAFDNFEVAAVRFVESVTEVNNTQKVHNIRHIFNGQRFGRVVFGQAVDDFFEQVAFVDLGLSPRGVQGTEQSAVDEVYYGVRIVFAFGTSRNVKAVHQRNKGQFLVFILTGHLKVQADAAAFPAAPEQDVGAGLVQNRLAFVNKVKQSAAFQIEKTFVERLVEIADLDPFARRQLSGDDFAAAAFNVVAELNDLDPEAGHDSRSGADRFGRTAGRILKQFFYCAEKCHRFETVPI